MISPDTAADQAPAPPADLRHFGRDLLAGVLSAVITLSFGVSYGLMIFSGDLSAFIAQGMPAALVCCFVLMFIVAMTSSLPFTIAGPDSNATVFLAIMAAGVAAGTRGAGGTPQEVLATVLMTIALSSVGVGLVLYGLGAGQRGRLVQFVPFPVLAGFLAGSGYLVLDGAFRVATGQSLSLRNLGLLGSLHWLVWVPALGVGGIIAFMPRRWRHYTLLPLTIGAGSLALHFGLGALGISTAEAQRMGLLFGQVPMSGLQLPFAIDPRAVHWMEISEHAAEFAALAIVSAITILLNSSSLSLATGRDVDFNHELRAAGLGNIASGLLGGITGFQSISRTMVNRNAGATSRAAAIIGALVIAVAVFGFPKLIVLLPKPVLIGILLAVAFAFLREWGVESFRRMPRHEYVLTLAILALIATQGVLGGVALGLVGACVLFVVNYGRLSCIKQEFSLRTHHSRMERSIEDTALLDGAGDRAYGLALQGFLFFGTSNSIISRLRERVLNPVDYVLIDFRLVHGLDASTSLSFLKIRQICAQRGALLVLTGLPEDFRLRLARAGLFGEGVREFADLDAGLEWVEGELLEAAQRGAERGRPDLRDELAAHFTPEQLGRLLGRLEAQDLPQGAVLFRRDEAADSVYFIESGRVTVSVPLDGGGVMRLRSFGAGTIVGEMGLYTQLPRSADVVADCPTRVRRLTLGSLRSLEADDPGVAIRFHNFVVKVLASRLAVTNDDYRAMH